MKNIILFSPILLLLLISNNNSFGICKTALKGKKAAVHLLQCNYIILKNADKNMDFIDGKDSQSSVFPKYISEINSGMIYFTESKNTNSATVSQQYFFTKYDSTTGTWEKPIDIEMEYSKFIEVNKLMNFQEIFITIDNDIYSVDLSALKFLPKKLNINTEYDETSPVLSPDGNTLYFVSNRPCGFGGKDIWASERSTSGNWLQPYNLGQTINTKDDEESPFLMSDGATFYFSSKGHNSIGGYDVFISTISEDGLWSVPENMGSPVNSVADDYYYITDSYGEMAYYSSGKLNEGRQNIFVIKYNGTNKKEIKTL
jgi:hypothetical protein